MRYVLLIFLFMPFFGCKPPSVSYGNASEIKGRYYVTTYIVGKDTLYFQQPTSLGYVEKINKPGIHAFSIDINRIGLNQVRITSFYFRDGAEPAQVKTASISPEPYVYTISLQDDSLAASYEGRVLHKTFYQKQTKGGLYIPVMLSGAPIVQTTSQEVTIIAELQ